jgi:DNA-binding response OmpR family regulator
VKTILIADDEQLLRDLVETTLSTPEVRILQAADGDTALEMARRERPDLMLLDLVMPGRPGIEVARELLQDPATANIPIIILTGVPRDEDRKQGLALGVRAYLMKPFSPLELLDRVLEVLAPAEPGRKGNGNQGLHPKSTA